MNRRNFFRKLVMGAAAIVVAPKILAEIKPKPVEISTEIINLRPNRTPLDIIIEHGWYSEAELRAREQLLLDLEKALFFGDSRPRMMYCGGGFIKHLKNNGLLCNAQ